MGPEPAVNAVFANKIAAIEDPDERAAFIAEQRGVYEEDVDLLRLASRARRRRRRAAGATCATRSSPASPWPPARTATSPTAATASPPSERASMPWCEDCVQFWNPNSLPVDGAVPDAAAGSSPSPGARRRGLKAPWHFKVLVACAAVYLVWRFLQLFGVLPDPTGCSPGGAGSRLHLLGQRAGARSRRCGRRPRRELGVDRDRALLLEDVQLLGQSPAK